MHKVILIIIATVVNEMAAGYDQSKLASNHIFIPSDQYSRENKYAQLVNKEAYFYNVNPLYCLPADIEPSWNFLVTLNQELSIVTMPIK
ncbi:hypothetical protein V5097_12500 [Arenibacter palladensis]|uniref:hypothetical protein n=1 Tax=Arenibacter palladensis TaxID=237373 RepID=UPI002FCEA1A3